MWETHKRTHKLLEYFLWHANRVINLVSFFPGATKENFGLRGTPKMHLDTTSSRRRRSTGITESYESFDGNFSNLTGDKLVFLLPGQASHKSGRKF